MPYTPPLYEDLSDFTTRLEGYFNQLAKRFSSPTYEELRMGIAQLESKYKAEVETKKIWTIWGWTPRKPDPKRLDQIACIAQLSENMPDVCNDERKKKQARFILEGALMYRDARIEYSYTGVYAGSGQHSFYGKADDRSALKVAIKKLLNINPKNGVDAHTLATRCTAYRDHLKQNGNSQKYSYINKDPDKFFSKLESMIVEAAKMAEPIAQQLQYIMFIQALLPVLKNYEQQITQALHDLVPLLVTKLKTTNCLKKVDVIEALNSLKLSDAVTSLLGRYIFPVSFELVLDAPTNQLLILVGMKADIPVYGDFLDTIKSRMMTYCQYALLGGYVMTLEQCDHTMPHLRNALQHAIGVQYDHLLDLDTKDLALTSLNVFAEFMDGFLIGSEVCKVWGGFECFKSELMIQLAAVHNTEELSTVAMVI